MAIEEWFNCAQITIMQHGILYEDIYSTSLMRQGMQ